MAHNFRHGPDWYIAGSDATKSLEDFIPHQVAVLAHAPP